MNDASRPILKTPEDWEAVYRQGTPPWDVGRPHAELIRVLDEYRLRPRTVLEIGCGSGADAVVLAKRRFEVTAIDCSPIAIERARLRAEQYDVGIHFVLDDIFQYVRKAPRFDMVYECGVYHALRRTCLERYLDVLWRVTQPGSYYFCIAGAPGEDIENGPPTVTEEEIRNELGRLFEVIHIRPTRLECWQSETGCAAWSCLMKRPKLGGN